MVVVVAWVEVVAGGRGTAVLRVRVRVRARMRARVGAFMTPPSRE